jgi:hypothetical protein
MYVFMLCHSTSQVTVNIFEVFVSKYIFLFYRCAEGFIGQRCEFKDLDGSYMRKYELVYHQPTLMNQALYFVINKEMNRCSTDHILLLHNVILPEIFGISFSMQNCVI